jgi:protoporphyrinogen oxidase
MKPNKPVVILGAGLAGLTAAQFLQQKGVPVLLYEAGNKIAGLAQSFHDSDGFTYDFGAHFVTNRLAKKIGVMDKCRTVKHYAETVWLGGKSYSHPFGLMRVPRMTWSGITTKLKSFGGDQKCETAADWFRAAYGAALANEVAIPLTEAWSGATADKLSPAVGDGISSGIGRTLYLKLASRLTGRAVSCGYSRELPEKASVYHVYPEGGIGTLCQKLAEGLDDRIRLQSPVEAILVEDGKAVGVRVNGKIQEASAVVSTAPVHVLGKIIEGSDALAHLTRFRYRPMIFVNLRLEGRGLLPDVVTWTPEKEFPFFRLTETPLSMPWLAPEGKTLITVDIGAEKGDEFWQMTDETLGELCVENLKPIIQNVKKHYLGCRVLKTPIAYPVFLREYEAERKQFGDGTGIENLYSVGRNGEFMHIFMEDVHHRTEKKMLEMITALESVQTANSSALTRERPSVEAFDDSGNKIGAESGMIESALPVTD